MARRNDHSREEIRQMALTVAETILSKEGHKALSARKVAKAIGYTVGTLYLVFENLDDLVLQIDARTLDALYEWLRARRASDAGAQECLVALSEAYIAYAETETARWNLLFEYIAEQGNELPAWYQAKLNRVFGLVEAALAPLAGHRTKHEIEQAARVLWPACTGSAR
jgi:AcrR family transcriptional regulator